MGQPNPPGDNVPLYEGLDSSWNDIVGAFPEDKRAELAPLLKQRIDQYEPLRQWEDLQKSGITPDQAGTALNLYSVIENNPRQVYDTIAKHLNITPQQAQEAVEQMEEESGDDPRIQTMQQQIDTLAQIAVAQRQQDQEKNQAAQQDAALEKDMSDLVKKYGESSVDEEEILMRMLSKNITAEQAYQEYTSKVNDIRSRRPAPMVLGGAGAIPSRAIDPTKLDSSGTKNLVAQMMQASLDEKRR